MMLRGSFAWLSEPRSRTARWSTVVFGAPHCTTFVALNSSARSCTFVRPGSADVLEERKVHVERLVDIDALEPVAFEPSELAGRIWNAGCLAVAGAVLARAGRRQRAGVEPARRWSGSPAPDRQSADATPASPAGHAEPDDRRHGVDLPAAEHVLQRPCRGSSNSGQVPAAAQPQDVRPVRRRQLLERRHPCSAREVACVRLRARCSRPAACTPCVSRLSHDACSAL